MQIWLILKTGNEQVVAKAKKGGQKTEISYRQEFIIAAIRQKISMRNKTLSPEELAKEYQDIMQENKLIM